MTWWQTLLIAVVPVLLTLLITNFAEAKRRKDDVDAREDERLEASNIRAEERKNAIANHYRDQRYQAHRHAANFSKAAIWRIESTAHSSVLHEFAGTPYALDWIGIDQPISQNLFRHMSELALVAGDESRGLADELWSQIREADKEIISHHHKETTMSLGGVNSYMEPLWAAWEEYVRAARKELGTLHAPY